MQADAFPQKELLLFELGHLCQGLGHPVSGQQTIEDRNFRAHSEGMRESGYRSMDEINAWKKRDPISAWRERLLESGMAQTADLDGIDKEITAMVDEAVAFAKDSPLPDPQTVESHVYSQ